MESKSGVLTQKNILISIVAIIAVAVLGVVLVSEQTIAILGFSSAIIVVLMKILQDDRIAKQQELRDEAKRLFDESQSVKVEEAKKDLEKVVEVAEKFMGKEKQNEK